MSNELILPGDFTPMQAGGTDAELDALSSSGFLPYVLLVGSSSNLAKEGKCPVGRWVLMTSKDKFVELTGEFEGLVLGRRAKATRKGKGVQNYYDVNHPEYVKIKKVADGGGMNGCWYGTEHLVWIERIEQFGTYHANSPTARTEAKVLGEIFKEWRDGINAKKPVPAPQFKASCHLLTYSSNGQKQWAPQFTRASTPFSKQPDPAQVMEQIKKFCDPPHSKVQTAQQPAQTDEQMG